eukprot:TRINITY_DN67323_c7_g1_i1.p1 TRINITY_DN67323_c7_g1~~TRINITY_DN67323_c7_g1_i1.p1  ORF type:complete len:344 (+),score=68.85 TRINITY_DN67323_c7_g1_i1:40-1032(+)
MPKLLLLLCLCVSTFAASDRYILLSTFTAFHANGTLDLSSIAQQAAVGAQMGNNFAMVNSGTGQVDQLTVAERKAIAAEWVKHGHKHNLYVCIQIGALALQDSQELARHAKAIGADGLMFRPPRGLRFDGVDNLMTYLQAVTKDNDMDFFYYYEEPEATNGDSHHHTKSFKMIDIAEAALGQKKLPTLKGYKIRDAADTEDFLQVINYMGGVLKKGCIWGTSPRFTQVGLGGASVAAHYFMLGNIVSSQVAHAKKGDVATASQLELLMNKANGIMRAYGHHSNAWKVAAKAYGLTLGPARLPGKTLTVAEEKKLMEELNAMNFFNVTKTA